MTEINRGNLNKSHVDIVCYVDSKADKSVAESLAKKFEVKAMQKMSDVEEDTLVLCLDADGLALVGNGQALRGDFTKMLSRLSPGNLPRELLVKASKIKGVDGPLTAIDATAGLGEDALLLAAAGFNVQLYEYDPVIAAILEDSIRRASMIPELADIVGRMQLMEADSLTALPKLATPPDVVLLDPMFPSRQKSALIKKKFQLLQQLESPCSDEKELLKSAIASHPRKVVIKRPLKGPFLAGRKPDYSLKGKAIRYDCIVFAREKN